MAKALLLGFLLLMPMVENHSAGKAGATLAPEIPWLGVLIRNSNLGVFVYRVYRNTPAHKAGLNQGDIIMAIDRRRVYRVRQTVDNIQRNKVGDTILIHYRQRGRVLQKSVKLVARPNDLN